MSKHTPKGWEVYQFDEDQIVIRAVGDGAKKPLIAICSSGLANAHLIAAAPSLLDAAAEALELLPPLMDQADEDAPDPLRYVTREEVQQACDQLQRAIASAAKAEGGE